MGKKEMKRYELFIESENWAQAERYYIANEEYPDGTWVKWEDVEREMIPVPEITITDVETVGSDPRERYLVELNGNFMGSYSDLERADAHVAELKRILNIGSLEEDNSQFMASCRTGPFILGPRITNTRRSKVMPLQRYNMNASDACVSYPDSNGHWCNARDVVELEKSYAKLEEANAELMNHLKSWLSMVRPVTGKETYYITNEFMDDICAAYNEAASKTGRDPI